MAKDNLKGRMVSTVEVHVELVFILRFNLRLLSSQACS